ncbi:integrase catalytic domain-containing protein [Trichonephila clavipes]|nr:integrase catalytic domain-containing protein [Trichonephila clavipes]
MVNLKEQSGYEILLSVGENNSQDRWDALTSLERGCFGKITGLRRVTKHIHDNGPAHTALIVIQFLTNSNIVLVPHPPCSPDLAPLDFCFCFPCEEKSERKAIQNVDEVKKNMSTALNSILRQEFENCFDQRQKYRDQCSERVPKCNIHVNDIEEQDIKVMEWKKWCEELPHLRNLKIPRLVLDSTLLEDDVELHSFCDASKKAYGAAIYLRTKSRNGISVKLVTSKSRVASLNCVTLPRLELLGALVAARLASKVKKIVNAQRSLFDKKEISSCISNLFPFVDGEVIVRVGGRLENASVPYLHKHPAILPKGSKLSKLYFNSLHTRLFHVGPQGFSNAVRQKFWPLSGRSIARKTVHQCVTCFKSRPILSSQIMGNLPSERVNISSPFTIAGLDLCGPFLVKYNQRKRTQSKLCVYVLLYYISFV